ncbi:MAG: prepilin-type N-terminal cleavage/methylation domain-containing protein [Sumerlaeia bacterium]
MASSMNRGGRAFTLVELTVTLVIFSVIALVGARALSTAFEVDRAVGARAQQGRSLVLLRELIAADCAALTAPSPIPDLPSFTEGVSSETGGKVVQFVTHLPPLAADTTAPLQAICCIVQYETVKVPPLDRLMVTRSVMYLLLDGTTTERESSLMARDLTVFRIAPGQTSESGLPKSVMIELAFETSERQTIEYAWSEPVFVREEEKE